MIWTFFNIHLSGIYIFLHCFLSLHSRNNIFIIHATKYFLQFYSFFLFIFLFIFINYLQLVESIRIEWVIHSRVLAICVWIMMSSIQSDYWLLLTTWMFQSIKWTKQSSCWNDGASQQMEQRIKSNPYRSIILIIFRWYSKNIRLLLITPIELILYCLKRICKAHPRLFFHIYTILFGDLNSSISCKSIDRQIIIIIQCNELIDCLSLYAQQQTKLIDWMHIVFFILLFFVSIVDIIIFFFPFLSAVSIDYWLHISLF